MKQYPLKYKDARLHKIDCQSLQPQQWLTSEALYFGLQYYCPEQQQSIQIMDPSLATFIVNNNDWEDLHELRNDFLDKEYILTPINDFQGENGTHWAALLIHGNSLTVFDSSSANLNIQNVASQLGAKILALIANDQKLIQSPPKISTYPHTPQQTNTYDCGLYSLAIIEKINKSILQKEQFDLHMVTPQYIQQMRIFLCQYLNQLL